MPKQKLQNALPSALTVSQKLTPESHVFVGSSSPSAIVPGTPLRQVRQETKTGEEKRAGIEREFFKKHYGK